jgi:hypothetical protein
MWETPYWSSLKNFINTLYISTKESYNKKVTESLYPAVCKILLYEAVTKKQHSTKCIDVKINAIHHRLQYGKRITLLCLTFKLPGIIMDCLFYKLRRFRINLPRWDIWPNEEETTELWKRITHQWTSTISILHPM